MIADHLGLMRMSDETTEGREQPTRARDDRQTRAKTEKQIWMPKGQGIYRDSGVSDANSTQIISCQIAGHTHTHICADEYAAEVVLDHGPATACLTGTTGGNGRLKRLCSGGQDLLR
jgi:hypothetical protein